MHVSKRLIAAASLWFSSILMMTMAVFLPEGSHMAGWSVLAATGGCVPVGWMIIEHVVARERQRTRDELRDIVRVVLQESSDLHSV